MKNILLLFSLLLAGCNTELSLKEQDVMSELQNKIQPGDIVFIRISNFLYRRVADTTMSWTSHVGFVYGKEDGNWMIAESAIPVSRKCTLKRFIERSEDAQISIRRLKKSLTSHEISTLKQAADKRMNISYHTGFRYHSKKQFCSKFVHDVYKEAIGIQIGEFETFKDLLNKNPDSPMGFWYTWFFGFVPWDRVTITPATQYKSDKFETVYENIESLEIEVSNQGNPVKL
jgi:hypothetical protein